MVSVVVVNKTAKKKKIKKIKNKIKQNKTAKHKLHLIPCELSVDFLCLVRQEFKEIENQPRLNQN